MSRFRIERRRLDPELRVVGGAARQLLPGLLLACAALLTQGCRLISQPTPMGLEYHAFEREVLGRTVRIDMYTLDGEQAELAANAAFARVKEVEQRTNDRHGISELRTAAAAAGSWMPLSSDLFRTLEVALETARLSNGAFDPTVGPYVMLWNETRTRNSLPAPERLEAAGRKVGWQDIELDGRRQKLRVTKSGMRLDLYALMHGYMCDVVLEALGEHSIVAARVQLGRVTAVSGEPPGEDGWLITVPTPEGGTRANTMSWGAVATAGLDEELALVDGRTYSEVLDPRTGLGLESRAVAVVIDRSACRADARALAVRVRGPQAGGEWIVAHGLQGWVFEPRAE